MVQHGMQFGGAPQLSAVHLVSRATPVLRIIVNFHWSSQTLVEAVCKAYCTAAGTSLAFEQLLQKVVTVLQRWSSQSRTISLMAQRIILCGTHQRIS